MSALQKIEDLQYTNPEHTNIVMTVTLVDEGQHPPYDGNPFPFHYVPQDASPITQLVAEELATNSYDIADYVPPPPVDPVVTFAPPIVLEFAKGKSRVIED